MGLQVYLNTRPHHAASYLPRPWGTTGSPGQDPAAHRDVEPRARLLSLPASAPLGFWSPGSPHGHLAPPATLPHCLPQTVFLPLFPPAPNLGAGEAAPPLQFPSYLALSLPRTSSGKNVCAYICFFFQLLGHTGGVGGVAPSSTQGPCCVGARTRFPGCTERALAH